MIWESSGTTTHTAEGIVVDMVGLPEPAGLPEPGTRVRILAPQKYRRHAWTEKTGVIVTESEARDKTAYKGEVYVKFDPPNDGFPTCPFHPSEFEVIE